MNRTDVLGGACRGAGRAGVAGAHVESAREGDTVGSRAGQCSSQALVDTVREDLAQRAGRAGAKYESTTKVHSGLVSSRRAVPGWVGC